MKFPSLCQLVYMLNLCRHWIFHWLGRRIMGAVCSAGTVERNEEFGMKNLGFSGKLKKEKSFTNREGDSSPASCKKDHRKKQKKRDSDELYLSFSRELKSSTPTRTAAWKVTQRGSFLGKAGERAVEVLDSLGSSMPKLNTSTGFSSSIPSRGNKISILAFEVANTITKGALLFQSLSEENIQILKKEILQSEGLQHLVSTDMKELLSLAEADKREEFNVFSREVARFGDACKDPQWHNLDRYFSRLDLEAFSGKQPRADAEKTMQELTTLAQHTAELYHELNAFDRFEQDYRQKIKEMESLNLPLKGESITIFQSELKHQKKIVRSLKNKSFWSRNLEEIVEKLVDIVIYMHQAISELLGNYGTSVAAVNNGKGPQRLGDAGLALHYANITSQINVIASRPTFVQPNTRDTLYHALPNNIKASLPSRLQIIDSKEVKAEIDKTLQWLVPLATNTIKAHQGFGWVGEWANKSNEFGDDPVRESNVIRLQTLHYADKQMMDVHLLELLTLLHQLMSIGRYRQDAMKPMANRSPLKGLDFQSKIQHWISIDGSRKTMGMKLSQEDRSLLEEVMARKRTPGVSRSEDLALASKKEGLGRGWRSSRSVGSSPNNDSDTRLRWDLQSSTCLDILDGLTF
ncbi:protein PSK SIMULATOR 2 isoform X2 [Prosopis cineraria]|uniref:protein PSK SIMULATOR 2 isoform X2 n=1 Tax=Prosopis cineraria TaxID=364024 RepID=UPI002410556C|nr:protein PSK SIMULATOR 2 isoform X2 [Prosopis cineraria]